MYQAPAIAVIMLLVGRELVVWVEFPRRYCIPTLVADGLVFTITHAVLRDTDITGFGMDVTLQKVFMTALFRSAGYMAALGMLEGAVSASFYSSIFP